MTIKIALPAAVEPIYGPRTQTSISTAYQNINHHEYSFMSEAWYMSDEKRSIRSEFSLWKGTYSSRIQRLSNVHDADDQTLNRFGPAAMLLKADELYSEVVEKTFSSMRKDTTRNYLMHVACFPAGMIISAQNYVYHINSIMFEQNRDDLMQEDGERTFAAVIDPNASNHAQLHTLGQINLFLQGLRLHNMDFHAQSDPLAQDVSKVRVEIIMPR